MKHLTFLFILLFSFLASIGQSSEDSTKYDFAILRYRSSALPRLALMLESSYINLDTLNLNNSKGNPYAGNPYSKDERIIFLGFNYMQNHGYELISSLAYAGDAYHIKEFIYRKKRPIANKK